MDWTAVLPLRHPRDVKPTSAVGPRGVQLKLCDFGCARSVATSGATDLAHVWRLTRWYRARNLLLGRRTTMRQVDAGAMGRIMGELADGQRPFWESEIDQLPSIQSNARSGRPRAGRVVGRAAEICWSQVSRSAARNAEGDVSVRPVSKRSLSFMQALLQMEPHQRYSSRRNASRAFLFRENVFDETAKRAPRGLGLPSSASRSDRRGTGPSPRCVPHLRSVCSIKAHDKSRGRGRASLRRCRRPCLLGPPRATKKLPPPSRGTRARKGKQQRVAAAAAAKRKPRSSP